MRIVRDIDGEIGEESSPERIVAWLLRRFAGRRLVVTTGFGMEGCALIDMIAREGAAVPVLYLDTGFLFPETLRLRDRLAERYPHLRFERRATSLAPEAQESRYGPELWAREPDACCTIRKVEPMREALADVDVWVTGLMRSQSPARAGLRVVDWDWQYQLVKVSPLASWDRAKVWEYVRQHGVPYNELHDRGYPTLGCTHCTLPVAGNTTGEYTREGRWTGRSKLECGLHQIRPGPLAPSTPTIGAGMSKDSKVEQAKRQSRHLRGTIAETLRTDVTHFEGDDVTLLKFHGTYQQDDRDARRRRDERADKAYAFMVRVALPAGALDADQYLALEEVADRWANGTLRVTTRQGFQFHGVLKRGLKETIAEVNRRLMTTLAACGDVSRNVMGCPAPVADEAHAAVRAVVRGIAERLRPASKAYHEIWLDGEKQVSTEEEPFYGEAYLPRKFKTGVALSTDNCVDIWSQDVGLVAVVDGRAVLGFNVLVGGGLGMTHHKADTAARLAQPLGFVAVEHAVEAAQTVAAIFRDHGNRADRRHARLKYLLAEWGMERFRTEFERRVGFVLHPAAELPALPYHDHLGRHRQPDGRWFYGVFIQSGRITDTGTHRLKTALHEIVGRFRPGVRLTGQQNVLLTDLDDLAARSVETILRQHGVAPASELSAARRFSMACPALPTCGLAVAESERAIPDLLDRFEAELSALGLRDEPLTIRMTGCPNGCARPYTADIAFVGRSLGLYNVYVGGGLGGDRVVDLFRADVRAEELLDAVRPLLVRWAAERGQGEGLSDFYQRLVGRTERRTSITGREEPTADLVALEVGS